MHLRWPGRNWRAVVNRHSVDPVVLDLERFKLLRSLAFFAGFGDVELWEVVHRAQWLRLDHSATIYRRGDPGRSFHIIARGRIDVHRNGQCMVQLGPGDSVGEMACLAPSPDPRLQRADAIVAVPATTIAFTPEALGRLSPATRQLFDTALIGV